MDHFQDGTRYVVNYLDGDTIRPSVTGGGRNENDEKSLDDDIEAEIARLPEDQREAFRAELEAMQDEYEA